METVGDVNFHGSYGRHVNQLIGDVFTKMAGILKIYTEYVQNFNDALNQIQVSLLPIVKMQ